MEELLKEIDIIMKKELSYICDVLGNMKGVERRWQRKNSISMQDIADELNISKVTVSKALNGKDGVSEELKKKIFAVAERYGYMLPDYGQRKTKKVGIVMSERFNSGDVGKFYMGMYEKIINELRKVSCSSMMITPNHESLKRDIETLETKGMFGGLILLGILDREVRESIDGVSLPKVYVDVYDETHKSDSVVTENIYSAYDITDYLIQMGYREIGFVGTIGATTSITDRYLAISGRCWNIICSQSRSGVFRTGTAKERPLSRSFRKRSRRPLCAIATRRRSGW